MAAEWTRLCREGDLRVAEPHVDVSFADDRRHRVTVVDAGEAYHISALVVRQAVVAGIEDLPVRVWIRNRAMDLVGFRIDLRNRLVAEAWVPKTGLTPDEFQLFVRTVATEADRFEFVLTGRDVE